MTGGSEGRREEVASMLTQRSWTDTDGTGVRAQLLAQKQLHELESQTLDGASWRHPLVRLATIWAGWRRLWKS